jgi:hypothetical protein
LSSGKFASFAVHFTISGFKAGSELSVFVDNQSIDWVPHPNIGVDRWEYSIPVALPLSVGTHSLMFELSDAADEDITRLWRFEVIEYGDDNECVVFSRPLNMICTNYCPIDLTRRMAT